MIQNIDRRQIDAMDRQVFIHFLNRRAPCVTRCHQVNGEWTIG